MTNPFPLKMAGFQVPISGRFSLPGDNLIELRAADDVVPIAESIQIEAVCQFQKSYEEE